MSKKIFVWVLLIALVLPMALGACKTETEAPPEPTEAPMVKPTEKPAEPEPTEVPPEPTEAGLDPSGQTVVFWHVWGTGTVGEGMVALVDEFNATNEWGITVEAVDQGGYSDLEDAMNAAIQSGDLPDVVVGYTNALDTWYSVGVLEDISAFIDDPDWGLTAEEVADFYPGVWNNGINAAGARVGFPHGQSANVIFYNSTWANELGFDSAPATLDELTEQACAATEANAADDDPDNDGTGGLVVYASASNVASFTFAQGGDFYTEDGMGYSFSKPEVQVVAEFLKELWDEGCGFPTESYPNPEFATRKALMTMSSTAGIPYQIGAFGAEDAIPDDWTLIAFPGSTADQKAVNAFAQNSAIVKSNPERSLAAWLFIKWFTSPESSVKWIEASAYHPIRASVVALLDEYAAANPLWGVGLELVPYGVAEPGWSSWSSVRRLVGDTFAAVLQGTLDQIPDLLAELDAAAADALAETQ